MNDKVDSEDANQEKDESQSSGNSGKNSDKPSQSQKDAQITPEAMDEFIQTSKGKEWTRQFRQSLGDQAKDAVTKADRSYTERFADYMEQGKSRQEAERQARIDEVVFGDQTPQNNDQSNRQSNRELDDVLSGDSAQDEASSLLPTDLDKDSREAILKRLENLYFPDKDALSRHLLSEMNLMATRPTANDASNSSELSGDEVPADDDLKKYVKDYLKAAESRDQNAIQRVKAWGIKKGIVHDAINWVYE